LIPPESWNARTAHLVLLYALKATTLALRESVLTHTAVPSAPFWHSKIPVGSSASGKGGGLDETPERISGKFVDLYIAENGALVIEELQGLAEEAGELDRHVLGIDGN
jgi:hypothetical protein